MGVNYSLSVMGLGQPEGMLMTSAFSSLSADGMNPLYKRTFYHRLCEELKDEFMSQGESTGLKTHHYHHLPGQPR